MLLLLDLDILLLGLVHLFLHVEDLANLLLHVFDPLTRLADLLLHVFDPLTLLAGAYDGGAGAEIKIRPLGSAYIGDIK